MSAENHHHYSLKVSARIRALNRKYVNEVKNEIACAVGAILGDVPRTASGPDFIYSSSLRGKFFQADDSRRVLFVMSAPSETTLNTDRRHERRHNSRVAPTRLVDKRVREATCANCLYSCDVPTRTEHN